MAIFVIQFTASQGVRSQELEAENYHLVGGEDQWTDFYDADGNTLLRVPSAHILRIDRKQS